MMVIIAFALSSLLGTWNCTQLDLPAVRVTYRFAADHTGTLVSVDASGKRTTKFTYRINPGQEIMLNTQYVTEIFAGRKTIHTIRIAGAVLDDLGYVYWTGADWATPSMETGDHCIRKPS